MITIELTDEAIKNISNMQRRCWDIANHYGPESPHYLQAINSFAHAVMTIFRWPGKVFAEDELSLIINGHIQIGVIWHPLKKQDEDGKLQPDPLLGTWSCHS